MASPKVAFDTVRYYKICYPLFVLFFPCFSLLLPSFLAETRPALRGRRRLRLRFCSVMQCPLARELDRGAVVGVMQTGLEEGCLGRGRFVFHTGSCCGGLQKHGVKNKFEFLTLFWDTPKMAQSQGFSITTPLLDQKKERTRRSKTCQKCPRIHVHRYASSGKDAGSEGRIRTHAPVPRMRQKWVPWVTNPTPSNKGLLTAWPEKKRKNPWDFFRTQKWFCLRSQRCIFSQNVSHIFHNVARGFLGTFFAHFFALFFRTVFLTEFFAVALTHFSNTCVQSCVLPTGFS